MRPIREYMGDRRVAAALAAAALLAVGYRLMQSRAVSPPPPDRAVEAPAPAAVPADPSLPRVARALPHPPPTVPAGWSGPAWNWERNPFLPPSGSGVPGAADAEDAPAADSSVPRLRGTVAGKGGGSAIFRGDRPDGGDVLVPAGGTIGGWTLAAVEPYRVFLRRGKETRIVELYRQ